MRHNQDQIETYGTSDFYLACYLRYMDYRIVRLDRDDNSHRRTFVFEDLAGRENDVLAYYNNDASVAPMAFANTIRDIRGMLFQK